MKRVVIVAFDGVQSLDIAGPAEVFAGATLHLDLVDGRGMAGYDVTIASFEGGAVATESAVTLLTTPFSDCVGPIDTLLIPGGFSVHAHADDTAFIDELRAMANNAERLVTVCSGALLAAATGALDGHTVTTHWARGEQLAIDHADIDVDIDPIFIHSTESGGRGHRDVWSSAGVTAGIDLTLALVERDHSTELAQTVAQWLVMFLRRPGGQSQFASPTWIRHAAPGPVQQAQHAVIDDPAGDHRVGRIARRVGMSERHFVRKFTAEVGVSPARFVSQVRVDAARHHLEQSDETVEVIARRCGFGTAETMRRTLLRTIGVSPDAYRRRFSHRPPGDRAPTDRATSARATSDRATSDRPTPPTQRNEQSP